MLNRSFSKSYLERIRRHRDEIGISIFTCSFSHKLILYFATFYYPISSTHLFFAPPPSLLYPSQLNTLIFSSLPQFSSLHPQPYMPISLIISITPSSLSESFTPQPSFYLLTFQSLPGSIFLSLYKLS